MLKSLWIEYSTHKILSPRQTCLPSYGFGQSRWWFMGVIFFSLGWVHFCTIGVIWGKLTGVNLNSYAGGKRIVNYLMLPPLLTFPRRVQIGLQSDFLQFGPWGWDRTVPFKTPHEEPSPPREWEHPSDHGQGCAVPGHTCQTTEITGLLPIHHYHHYLTFFKGQSQNKWSASQASDTSLYHRRV